MEYPSLAPLIPLPLDRERHLRLDWGALKTAEDRLRAIYGQEVHILELLTDGTGLTPAQLITTIWAGLRHEDPELTEAHVGGFIYPGNLHLIIEALRDALRTSTPSATPDGENGTGEPSLDPPPAVSTGSPSGVLVASPSG